MPMQVPPVVAALSARLSQIGFERTRRAVSALGLSVFFQGAVVAVTLLVVGACLRFRLAPSTATANLRPVVELYTLIVMVGLPLTLALQRGVVL